jgi:hypothetical protein
LVVALTITRATASTRLLFGSSGPLALVPSVALRFLLLREISSGLGVSGTLGARLTSLSLDLILFLSIIFISFASVIRRLCLRVLIILLVTLGVALILVCLSSISIRFIGVSFGPGRHPATSVPLRFLFVHIQ